MVLQGDGVRIDVHGQTLIDNRTHTTSARFTNLPDVPLESIEVSLPQGRFSEFAANLPRRARGSFCGQRLMMPTSLKGQNGRELRVKTKIQVTGCPRKKKQEKARKAKQGAPHRVATHRVSQALR